MPLTGDGYFAGEYPGGTTTVEGAPVSAAVLVYQRDSGQLIAQTESSQSGEWIVTGVDISKAHDIVGRKEGFNDVIVSNVTPTSMVDITYTGAVIENADFTGADGFFELVGGIPPYSASVVAPLPTGLFPVVNGRQLIIDGSTLDDGIVDSVVRVTSSNGAEKDIPLSLVVGFKAPANFKADVLEAAGVFSVALSWEVTNSTQSVNIYKSAIPFDMGALPAPIAVLSGDVISYVDDAVVEDETYYYLVSAESKTYTLYSGQVDIVVSMNSDEHFALVELLMNFDSYDAGGNFVDLSSNDVAITTHGNAAISAAEQMFGGGALLCSGGLDKLSISGIPISANEDFTIEAWMYPNNIGQNSYAVVCGNFPDNIQIMRVDRYGSIIVALTPADILSSSGVDLGKWSHFALSRAGNVLRLFIDGGLKNQKSSTTAFTVNAIGAAYNSTVYGKQYIDELRITKGVGRYTENFTPPTEPFPNF